MSSTTIYLKLPQVKEVYEPEVYLGMIADVHSSDRAAEAKAKAVKITSFSGKGKEAVFVGNVMELVEKIEKTGQNIQVDNIGESDFVVTYRAGKKESLVWEWMKTAMVSAVAFFGAGRAAPRSIITDTTMNQTSKMATSAIRTIKITRSPFRCQIYWSMRRKKGVQTQAARPRALAAAGATTPILMTRPARGSRETSSRRAKKTPRRIRGSRPHCRRGRWCRSVI